MFKNFDKVFKFSFKNQAGTKSFIGFTIVLALILLIAPPVIMLIVGGVMNKQKEIEGCGAETIYVVNDTPGDPSFFSTLSGLPEPEFDSIDYVICSDIDDALEKSSSGRKSLILLLDSGNGLKADIVIPEESEITKKQAKNYFKFIDRNSVLFTGALSGIDEASLKDLTASSEYKTYTADGFARNVSIDEDILRSDEMMREQVMKVVRMAIPYATIILLYFVLLSYGQTLAQSVVMEKESKLMDTMLVSVKPEALIFGKLLASISAVIVQVVAWIFSIVLGFVTGNLLMKAFYPEVRSYMTVFFSGMKDLNVFRPWNIALAVLFLILGVIVYLCLAAIAGAMSSNKEEVGSKSSLFIFPLLISFMICIGGGGMNTATTKPWMLIIPYIGAMLMPANVSLGAVSPVIVVGALVCFIAFVIVLVIAAGRIYKMMSLYKGNKISISEVLKRSFSKQP